MTAQHITPRSIAHHILFLTVLLLGAAGFPGCGGSDELAQDEPRHPGVKACCDNGGILPGPINGPYNEYAAFVEPREAEQVLWFTSSRPVKGKKATSLPGEMLFAKRSTAAPSMIKSWSVPMRNVPVDPVFDTWTRGTVAIHGDEMILAAEQPVDKVTPFLNGGTSYHLYLWQLTRNAAGIFADPKIIDRVNVMEHWSSQPALSPDGSVLLFVSDRPNPQSPADTSINIWISRRMGGVWQEPSILAGLATPGSDMSPQIDAGGNVYFASNWDFRTNSISKNGFDIWSAGDLASLLKGSARTPKNMNEISNMEGCKSPCKYDVNTQYDEIFPHVLTSATGRYLFYSSNRPEGYGGYDIYCCMLPAPCVRIKPVVTCYLGGSAPTAAGDVLGREMPGEMITIQQGDSVREVRSGEVVDVRPGIPLVLAHVPRPMDCERMECKPKEYIPELTDEIRKVEIPCDCNPPTLETILISDASGIPYFITGYWAPNTTANFTAFNNMRASGRLKDASFINPTDYDYACAARSIDRFFEANVYAKIENALKTVETCTNSYSLLITVVGFTDACGLSHGRYIGPDIEFGNLLIPGGQDMWASSLKEKGTGRSVQLRERGQMGNVILSMLRAHYTMRTIDEEMSTRSEKYRKLKSEKRILFNVEGMGIFRTSQWRSTQVPVAVSASSQCRKGKIKASSAACNNPEGRRIEIYVKQVRPGSEDLFTKPFETDFLMPEQKDPEAEQAQCDCFRLNYAFRAREEAVYVQNVIEGLAPIASGREKLVLVEPKSPVSSKWMLISDCISKLDSSEKDIKEINDAVQHAIEMLKQTNGSIDPDCLLFRISFGTFVYSRNAETLAEKLRSMLGTEVDVVKVRNPESGQALFAVHTGHFKTPDDAQKVLSEYERRLKTAKMELYGQVIRKTEE
jgi:hypothetical protein